MPPEALVGRRALVTGASRGLGRAIADCLLASGAEVALCARTRTDLDGTARELQANYPRSRILAVTCDIGRRDEVDALYDRVIAAFGTLDVVVNNAGVHGPIGSIDKVDWDAWVEAIAVNLCGTAYSCRRAVVAFKSAARHDRRGKIINLSGGGATSPQPGLTAYGASKAGLVRLTETLAGEVREFGIDVNAVAPGALATRLTLELRDAGPDRIGAAYFEKVEASLAEGGTPTARATDLILFLASAASDGITGRLISAVWDDWQAWPRHLAELAESDVYTLRRIAGRDRGIPWGDK